MPRPLTPGRLRCLQALAFGALGMAPEEKAAAIERIAPGKTGFHALTNTEADRLIDEFKRAAGQAPTRPQARERRRGRAAAATGDLALLATPAQRARLAELGQALVAVGVTPVYAEGICHRACGRPAPRTSAEAEKVIEALKAVLERLTARGDDEPEEPA